jgi:hypothetical protein
VAGEIALERRRASTELFVALEPSPEIATIGGQMSLRGAGRGEFAQEELEWEDDLSLVGSSSTSASQPRNAVRPLRVIL